MAKVFVVLPVMGGYFPQMVGSLIKWIHTNPGGHDLHFVTLHNESLISRGRNKLATAFLQSDCDYMLMIDADLEFPSDALDRLIRDDKDLIAAPYTSKSTPPLWTIRFFDHAMPTYVSGVMPVRFVSGGFTLIKRHVLEKMAKSAARYRDKGEWYYDFFSPHIRELFPGEPEYLPEDWSFCQRANDAGFEIFCDFDIRLLHFGMHGYGMVEIDNKLPANPMLPFLDNLQDMTSTVSALSAPAPTGSGPANDLSAMLNSMLDSFKEVQGMLGDLATGKLNSPSQKD